MAEIRNLIDLIQTHGNNESKGITFVSDQGNESYISYKDLYDKALHILYSLQARGLKKGEELVFQIDDNHAFVPIFWACILGGIIPVPVSVGYNDEHKLKMLRILSILNKPRLITTRGMSIVIKNFADKNGYTSNYDVIFIADIEEIKDVEHCGVICECMPEDIAFIQFSSGSTGDPKGVMLTHENVIVNTTELNIGHKLTDSDSALSWMPLTHDMGLIGFHINATLKGIEQYIIHTSLFVGQPVVWMQKTTEYKPTILFSPNFGYKHLLNFLTPENSKGWDLSSVRSILNGAEPISSELCHAFIDKLKDYGLKKNVLLPVYGLAEATVAVSITPLGEEIISFCLHREYIGIGQKVREVEPGDINGVNFVDLGYPVKHCYIRVSDKNNEVMDEDVVGIVQISGKNVTKGYYNNKEATSRLFTDDGWLNTGDLGFIRGGRLVITGREKDIIFVNGQNFYPHDIERVAEDLEGVGLGRIASCGVFNQKLQKERL